MKNLLFAFILISVFLNQTKVYADRNENLGQFRISEFSISPRLRLQEPSQGGFEIQKTYLGFEWKKDDSLRGQVLLGSNDLTKPAIWYQTQTRPDFGIVEAYLEGKSEIGDFRAGLVNTHQTFEGETPEWSWYFPETRVRKLGWFINRDFGFQFRFKTSRVSTVISLTNGEAQSNLDNKFWYSGNIKYQSETGYGFLLSTQTGQTNSLSTAGLNPSVASSTYKFNFNTNLDSKIRLGSFALFKETERNLYLLEGGSGDIIQNSMINRFAFGHLDLAFQVAGDLRFLLRYEQNQTNMEDYNTVVRMSSAGFMLLSNDRLQSITFYGTRNQESPEIINDEYYIIFRLNSRSMN